MSMTYHTTKRQQTSEALWYCKLNGPKVQQAAIVYHRARTGLDKPTDIEAQKAHQELRGDVKHNFLRERERERERVQC